ncbi:hypothetical protein ANN_02403 [Periplaneta americana]|uniref:Uncharacterized protein n=1 Tax=Periplaneta americana TaxID=6978 RepID=A0ABQ8TXA2_PERAM|nr:hypothetical protein ANN_02403 [Periplaneta americana]
MKSNRFPKTALSYIREEEETEGDSVNARGSCEAGSGKVPKTENEVCCNSQCLVRMGPQPDVNVSWKAEIKKLLGRPRRRWVDNIKMNLRELGYDGRDWINLAQDRDQWWAHVRAAMNLRVP